MLTKYSIYFVLALVASISFISSKPAYSFDVEIKSSYDKSGVTIDFMGVPYNTVKDFAIDGIDVTYEIHELINSGAVVLTHQPEGFSLFLPIGIQDPQIDKEALRKFTDGDLSVILDSGIKITKNIAIDTVPIENGLLIDAELDSSGVRQLAAFPPPIGGRGSPCGSYSSAGNPYPCCDNDYNRKTSANDGNCTWWAWKQARDNWGVSLPNWANAGSWATNAKKAGYAVSTFPIARTIATSSGHVAYVTWTNEVSLTVSEMNCGINNSQRQGKLNSNYKPAFFNTGYITPLVVRDFWLKNSGVVYTSSSKIYNNQNTNFDAQFKVTKLGYFPVQRFMMAVHKADSNLTWVRDFVNSNGTVFVGPDTSSGLFQSGKLFTYFNSNEKGNYYIIPKVMISNKWVTLGKGFVSVR